MLPGPPSGLDLDRQPSAARSTRHEMQETRRELASQPGPDRRRCRCELGRCVFGRRQETPGAITPTPDQDRVDDIGKALGVQYEDNEKLKASDKIAKRDKHRWELDPASSDDYKERD